jgi:catechol-2,3-dioxygenase
MIPVTRLNHAVLYVRDLDTSVEFYRQAFGFEEIAREGGGRMAFLRARGSANHHDLGLLALGPQAPRPPRGATGLYHLAWEVPTIDDLAAAAGSLAELGALSGASDHGATKSLYGQDPDGNEFEVMWMVPRELWGEFESQAPIAPLDLERELARFGQSGAGRPS